MMNRTLLALLFTTFCIGTAFSQQDDSADGIEIAFHAKLYEMPEKIAQGLLKRIDSGDNDERLRAMTLIPDLASKRRITEVSSATATTKSGNTKDTASRARPSVYLNKNNAFPQGLNIKVMDCWIGKDGRVYGRLEILHAEAPVTGKRDETKKPRTGKVRQVITREIEMGVYLENDLEDFVAYLETDGDPLLFTCTASYDDDKLGERAPLGKSRNVLNIGQAFAFRHVDDAKDFMTTVDGTAGVGLAKLAEKKFAKQTHKWILMSAPGSRFVIEDFHRTYREDQQIIPRGLSIDADNSLSSDKKTGRLGLNVAVINADKSKPSGFRSSQYDGEKKAASDAGLAVPLEDVDYLEEGEGSASANAIILRYKVTKDSSTAAIDARK